MKQIPENIHDYELSFLGSPKRKHKETKIRVCYNDMVILTELLVDYHLRLIESRDIAISEENAVARLNFEHRIGTINKLVEKFAISCDFYDRKCKVPKNDDTGVDALTASARRRKKG